MNKYKFVLTIFLFPFLVSNAQLSITFTQLNMGCSGVCDGQVKATVSGGIAPYHFDWGSVSINTNDSSVAINLCEGRYNMSVYDALNNRLDTSVYVKVYRAPNIELSTDPEDPWYIQSPTGTFQFTNLSADSIVVEGWKWDFGDGITSFDISPTHTFDHIANFDIVFTANYRTTCDTSLNLSIAVKTVRLLIPNIITPNNDGVNDIFIITQDSPNSTGSNLKAGSEYPKINDFYKSNELIIFNRWTQKVYEQKNYQNDWDGGNLKDGVYFYVLKCHGEFEDDTFKGSLTIMGSGK